MAGTQHLPSPRVVIGAPVYNHERECRTAIESILAQTFSDFRLLIVDDCSTDATPAIAADYTADPRVTVIRNVRRLGMIGNWRRAFDECVTRWPEAQYFAWASDHDLWEPRWLERLVAELDRAPAAVWAYPLNRRIDVEGVVVDKTSWSFETRGLASRRERLQQSLRYMSAGNMIYGLGRVEDIRACGVFRHVLMPDRLLLVELALRGEFRQVPEVLWFRRWYGAIFSLARQRRAFFPDGRPLYALVPWWISHAVVVAWLYGVRGEKRPAVSKAQGLGFSVVAFFVGGYYNLGQQLKQLRMDLLERLTFLKPVYEALHMLGVDKVKRRTHKLQKRWSKQVGLADAMKAVEKNFSDAERRQRFRAKVMKRMRGTAHRAMHRALRIAAPVLTRLPVVGPSVASRLKQAGPASDGAGRHEHAHKGGDRTNGGQEKKRRTP